MDYKAKVLKEESNNELMQLYNLPDGTIDVVEKIENMYFIDFSQLDKEWLYYYISKASESNLQNEVLDIFTHKNAQSIFVRHLIPFHLIKWSNIAKGKSMEERRLIE